MPHEDDGDTRHQVTVRLTRHLITLFSAVRTIHTSIFALLTDRKRERVAKWGVGGGGGGGGWGANGDGRTCVHACVRVRACVCVCVCVCVYVCMCV